MDQNNTTPNRGPKKARPPSGTRRRPPKSGASVQMQVQDHIGRQLRAVYDDLLSQPVPDRFLELLEQLDQKTPRKPGTDPATALPGKLPEGDL